MLLATLLTACDLAHSPEEDTKPTETRHYNAAVATDWFDLSLQLVEQTPGFSPPVVARAYGYMGVAFYEAVVPGMPEYQSFEGRLKELETLPQPVEEDVYWPVVSNSVLAEITRKLFRAANPEQLDAIDALENSIADDLSSQVTQDQFSRSEEYGKAIAEAIYSWSQSDGGYEGFANNFPDDYNPPKGPGLWIPTPPDYQSALQPDWGNNRPLAVRTMDECPVKPPPSYSEAPGSEFYKEALEVYETVQLIDDEELEIAQYWADDPGETATPPGHWISILNQVISKYNYSLDIAAEAYARLGIALADAFIACWHEKYEYNLIRPISYIQQVIDGGWNKPEVTDPVITPPFPEYPSGHSVQSAAAAAVLTELFGNTAFTDHTHKDRGLPPRAFSSFWEAAEEAAISRLYGGIHYRTGIEYGVDQGHCIGEKVNSIHLKIDK